MSTPPDLPAGSVPSFLVNQILVGDVMVLPMGYMFVEKAVGQCKFNLHQSGLEDTWLHDEPKSEPTSELTELDLTDTELNQTLT